jgi:hypothetical protein
MARTRPLRFEIARPIADVIVDDLTGSPLSLRLGEISAAASPAVMVKLMMAFPFTSHGGLIVKGN